jgi:hypothetical protein
MRKIFHSFLLIVLSGFLFHYKTIGQRWEGSYPIIELEISSFHTGFQSYLTEKEVVKQILLAVQDWNQTSGSTNIHWKVKKFYQMGENATWKINPVELREKSIETGRKVCDLGEMISQQKMATFHIDYEPNPDCTDQICAYIWSCENKIISADIVLNNSEHNWNSMVMTQYSGNIYSGIQKAIGYISGLTHCRAGDRPEDCNLETSAQGEILQRLPEYEKESRVGVEEKNGLHSIYGAISMPFPSSGKYALNEEEFDYFIQLQEAENHLRLDSQEARRKINERLNDLVSYSEKKEGKKLREMYEEFASLIESQTSSLPVEGLLIQKRTLLGGIYAAVKTKEDIQEGRSDMSLDFVDYTISRQMALWNLTIDTLGENR